MIRPVSTENASRGGASHPRPRLAADDTPLRRLHDTVGGHPAGDHDGVGHHPSTTRDLQWVASMNTCGNATRSSGRPGQAATSRPGRLRSATPRTLPILASTPSSATRPSTLRVETPCTYLCVTTSVQRGRSPRSRTSPRRAGARSGPPVHQSARAAEQRRSSVAPTSSGSSRTPLPCSDSQQMSGRGPRRVPCHRPPLPVRSLHGSARPHQSRPPCQARTPRGEVIPIAVAETT